MRTSPGPAWGTGRCSRRSSPMPRNTTQGSVTCSVAGVSGIRHIPCTDDDHSIHHISVTDPVAPPGAPSASPAASPRVMCIGSAALDVLMEIDACQPRTAASQHVTGCSRAADRQPRRPWHSPRWACRPGSSRWSATTSQVISSCRVWRGRACARSGSDARLGARSALSVGLIRPSPADTRRLVALSALGTTLDIDAAALEACRAADWIHVDHAGWPLVTWLRQQGVRTPIAVDGGNPLIPADVSAADLYVPGETELLRSTGCPDIPAALQAASRSGARLTDRDPGCRGLELPGRPRPGRSTGPTQPSGHAVRGPGSPAAAQLHAACGDLPRRRRPEHAGCRGCVSRGAPGGVAAGTLHPGLDDATPRRLPRCRAVPSTAGVPSRATRTCSRRWAWRPRRHPSARSTTA